MMEELDDPVHCITLHPGFNSVCLDKWVLETAAVRLKTKKKKKNLKNKIKKKPHNVSLKLKLYLFKYSLI